MENGDSDSKHDVPVIAPVEVPIVTLNRIIDRYQNLADKKERYKTIIGRNINILQGDNDMEYIQFILTNFNNLTDIKERINAIIEQVYPNIGDNAKKNGFINSVENANISVVAMATTLRALTIEMRDELKQLKEIHNDAIEKLRKERGVGGLGPIDSDSDARSRRLRRKRPTSTVASSSQSDVPKLIRKESIDSLQNPKGATLPTADVPTSLTSQTTPKIAVPVLASNSSLSSPPLSSSSSSADTLETLSRQSSTTVQGFDDDNVGLGLIKENASGVQPGSVKERAKLIDEQTLKNLIEKKETETKSLPGEQRKNILRQYISDLKQQYGNTHSIFTTKFKEINDARMHKYLKYAVDSERINKPSLDTYESKYLKYKNKYLKLKESLL